MNKKPNYIKNIYWITEEEDRQLREEMSDQGIKVGSANGIPCRPLKEKDRLAIVVPSDWNKTCARQGSWYRGSKKDGLYLVISSYEIEDYEGKKEAVISLSDFTRTLSATTKEKEEMIEDLEYMDMVPDEWKNVTEKEKRIALKFARRFGSSVKNYDQLFLSHTANHSNFITPRFFIKEDHGKIPYSIDRSAHLCSCCLELFQIIGSRFKKKLVSPCTGAVVYANLKPDQFMLVEKRDNRD